MVDSVQSRKSELCIVQNTICTFRNEMLCVLSQTKSESTHKGSQGCAAAGFTPSWTGKELQMRQLKDLLLSKVLDSFLAMENREEAIGGVRLRGCDIS